MRGLQVQSGTLRYREDLPEPETSTDECRVQVLTAGVCATDLALIRGYMEFDGVPGHEFVGTALDGSLAGRRVVGEINAACGGCDWCRRGLERHCPQRTVLGISGRQGCFAEQISLPELNLHPVPDRVSNDAATFVEPLAAAYEIIEQLDPQPGSRALVVGDGRLGLLCSHVLNLQGLDVTVAGRHPEREQLLPNGVRFATELPDRSAAHQRFDLAVEASGSAAVLQRLIPRVRPRGTIVLKTTTETPASLDLSPAVVNELTLIGSRCGPFAPALEALAAGSIDVESLIDGRFSLEDGAAAIEQAGEPGVLKILIDVAR